MDLEAVRARLGAREWQPIDRDVTSRAAVAAVLRAGEQDLEILLIKRAERGSDPWSGHMAFPGGRQEPGESLLETAIRETREELDLDLQAAELLGRLDDLRAVGRSQQLGLVIAPFVFGLRATPGLSPNDEVDEVHWSPIAPLTSGERDTWLDYPYQGQTIRMPGFQVGERIVWGLTYRMLQILFERLR